MRGVDSALPRCAFAFARFSIQLGCALIEDVGLGDSGFVRALSIQLDLVGLKRLEGLAGGDVALSSGVLTVYADATDLLRL